MYHRNLVSGFGGERIDIATVKQRKQLSSSPSIHCLQYPFSDNHMWGYIAALCTSHLQQQYFVPHVSLHLITGYQYYLGFKCIYPWSVVWPTKPNAAQQSIMVTLQGLSKPLGSAASLELPKKPHRNGNEVHSKIPIKPRLVLSLFPEVMLLLVEILI